MTNAFSGVGAVFQRAGVAIAEINSIAGPDMTRDSIDATSLDSTGGYREYIPGFRDGGEITLNMNFTHTGFRTMLDDFASNSNVAYTIVLSNSEATEIDFDGFVQKLGFAVPTDDKVTSDVTIKITGQPTMSTV